MYLKRGQIKQWKCCTVVTGQVPLYKNKGFYYFKGGGGEKKAMGKELGPHIWQIYYWDVDLSTNYNFYIIYWTKYCINKLSTVNYVQFIGLEFAFNLYNQKKRTE